MVCWLYRSRASRWTVVSLLSAALLGASAGAVVADEPEPDPLAIGAAIVPGVLLHGSGSYVAGERRTARRLLALEGAGLAVTGVGAVPMLATGASRWVSGPSVALIATGMGMVLVGWAADIYSAKKFDPRRAYDLDLARELLKGDGKI